MSDIAISVRNVSKCYRVFEDQRARLLHAVRPAYTKGMQEIWALKDINFEIKRGEAVAIIGRNGSGKSTLLEILTGTLTPTTGEVKVNGRVSALLELGSGFNPEYSGRDNVILNGLLLGLSKEDILNRFSEIEAFSEISDAIDRPVKTYSSGMMMRLAFAVQVLCDPDILIIDEALSVGDFFFQQKCLSYIRGLCAKGVTLLFVSHDMGTVRDVCARSILLSKGKVDADGDSARVVGLYFSKKQEIETDHASKAVNQPDDVDPSEKDLCLNNPTWMCNPEDMRPSMGHIMAVGFYSAKGTSVTSVEIGEELNLKILFTSYGSLLENISIGIINSYGQLVTCFNSKTATFQYTGKQRVQLINFKFPVLLEAGGYSIIATLGRTLSPNRGEAINQTPNIGPLMVEWDYDLDEAPFVGMFGLPVEFSSLTE